MKNKTLQQPSPKLKYESFAPKLGEWAEKFKPFIESKEMWDIMQRIKKDGDIDVIVPKSSDTFRAFSTISPRDLKVVFYLMDPYPRIYKGGDKKNPIYQATGIAMDCSNSPDGTLQPSLENWYDGISKELGVPVVRSKSLEYLHEQGVMLLNTDLTCIKDRTQSHEGVWEPFQKYFLQEVVGWDTHLIFVLCGKSSLRMEQYINPFCKIFKLSHPAAASHTHTDWDSKGVFMNINRILKENNTRPIYWNKADWEDYKQPPF